MATVVERRVAAVVGSMVADAAAQPLHWNYKLDKLNGLLGDRADVEFWDPSANPYYTIETGRQSCYGDQAYVILKSLVECKGFNIDHMKEETYKCFGPDSAYDDKNSGATKATLPVSHSWRHGSIKHFLKKYEDRSQETGSDSDEQIDCVAKIAPLVALYAGSEDLLDRAEEVICLTQTADTTVATGLAGVRLLEHYILHGPDPDALNHVIKELSNPRRKNPQDLDKAIIGQLRKVVEQLGMSHGQALSGTFPIN